ncbi:hypothetical protein [Shinella sp.]|uniref:hypothetical protein n=1 Tax=Shinella sp. TaxID=1870904 RepID=UPI002899ED7E|nr:hypothetical protein [Shinella sp.]
MPWWVSTAIVVGLVFSALPFHYARYLARGETEGRPTWYGGFTNLYLVVRILKAHARRGDRWAGPAYMACCIGAAMMPAVLVGLIVQEYWFR